MWVRALRGGKYSQAFGKLKVFGDGGARHCCLGVLCELYDASMRRSGRRGLRREAGDFGAENLDEECSVLPARVQDWSGLRSCTGEFEGRGGIVNLTDMNDGGRTFRQIARIIEVNVDRL